jgi:hypothetical protein
MKIYIGAEAEYIGRECCEACWTCGVTMRVLERSLREVVESIDWSTGRMLIRASYQLANFLTLMEFSVKHVR